MHFCWTCIAEIDDNMFNSGVSKGQCDFMEIQISLLSSFREVNNVWTFTCPEKVFPSANWQIPSDSEIAFRLGLPEQQCMQGKTDEDGSQQYQICYANIHEIMRFREHIMFPTQAHLSMFQPIQPLLGSKSALPSYNDTVKGSSNNVQ